MNDDERNEPVNIVEFKVGVPEIGGLNAIKVILRLYDLVKVGQNLPQPIPLDTEVPPDTIVEFLLDPDQAKSFGQQLLDATDLLEICNE